MNAEPIAYDRRAAAEAAGLSYDTIRAAINAGDLTELHPPVNGKPITKGIVMRTELERWLKGLAA